MSVTLEQMRVEAARLRRKAVATEEEAYTVDACEGTLRDRWFAAAQSYANQADRLEARIAAAEAGAR